MYYLSSWLKLVLSLNLHISDDFSTELQHWSAYHHLSEGHLQSNAVGASGPIQCHTTRHLWTFKHSDRTQYTT